MKTNYLLFIFFLLSCSLMFPMIQAMHESRVMTDFDFDQLEQQLIECGLDAEVVIPLPSKTEIFLRSLVDPVMVPIIRACDYIRMQWIAIMAMFTAQRQIEKNKNDERVNHEQQT